MPEGEQWTGASPRAPKEKSGKQRENANVFHNLTRVAGVPADCAKRGNGDAAELRGVPGLTWGAAGDRVKKNEAAERRASVMRGGAADNGGKASVS